MNFSTDVKTLAFTVFGCGLAFAAVSLLAPTGASAQIRSYYRAGVWDAFSGRNDKGGAVCGVGNTNPVDNRRLSIRREIDSTGSIFSVSKPGWSIPDNTRVAVVMQIGLNTPWTEQAIGHGQTIEWPLDRGLAQPFDQQFRSSSSMTLTFPDGNEPPWTIPLTGSSAISDTFGRCVSDLARQVQAEQAAVNPDPAAQSQAPAATQPFAPPTGGPPVDAPPAGLASPTQPVGTQPAH